MKRNSFLFKAVILTLLLMLLVGCGELHEAMGTPSEAITHEETTTDGTDQGGVESDEFTVSLMYAGEPYIPKIDMCVRWSDGVSVHEAAFGEDGVARVTGLDGDYQVTLTELPKNLTYNPNIYVATNDSKHVIIELYKYKSAKRGGEDIYKCITIKDLGSAQSSRGALLRTAMIPPKTQESLQATLQAKTSLPLKLKKRIK